MPYCKVRAVKQSLVMLSYCRSHINLIELLWIEISVLILIFGRIGSRNTPENHPP